MDTKVKLKRQDISGETSSQGIATAHVIDQISALIQSQGRSKQVGLTKVCKLNEFECRNWISDDMSSTSVFFKGITIGQRINKGNRTHIRFLDHQILKHVASKLRAQHP